MSTNSNNTDRVNELAGFVAEHGRFPRKSASASAESSGYAWLKNVRLALTGDGRRSPDTDLEQLLDDTVPGWADGHREPSPARDRGWERDATLLEAFVAEHGRFPRSGHNRPVRERALGVFLNKHHGHARRPERAAWLDEHTPGWRETSEAAAWEKRLSKVVAFVAEHHRLPTSKSTTTEASLTGWVAGQRASPRTPEQRAALDAELPGWHVAPTPRIHEHDGLDYDERWANRAAQVTEFLTVHGRLPLAVNAPGLERTLGLWVRSAHYALDGRSSTKLTPERLDWLDANLPGWRRAPSERSAAERGYVHHDDDRWQVQATAVAAFITEHGRPPCSSEAGAVEAELGSFLATQRKVVRSRPDREAWLNVNAPGWRDTSRDTQWRQSLKQLASFIELNDRFPNVRFDNERKLARWVGTQRNTALSPERSAELRSRIPGWAARPAEDIWASELARLVTYKVERGSYPHPRSQDPETLSLHRWLTKQIRSERNPERVAALDTALPGWRTARTAKPHTQPREDPWFARGRQVKEYVEEHGEFPQKGAGGPEGKLGLWLHNVRFCLHGESIFAVTPERLHWLDGNLPGWRLGDTREADRA